MSELEGKTMETRGLKIQILIFFCYVFDYCEVRMNRVLIVWSEIEEMN